MREDSRTAIRFARKRDSPVSAPVIVGWFNNFSGEAVGRPQRTPWSAIHFRAASAELTAVTALQSSHIFAVYGKYRAGQTIDLTR